MKKVLSIFLSFVAVLSLAFPAMAQVEPPEVNTTIVAGESIVVTKTVTTPEIPTVVDIVLLEDETGSFADDIGFLQTPPTASNIFDAITPPADAQFGVTGFRDYPVSPFGNAGDWVYRQLSVLSPAKADWLNGIATLSAGGGGDTPEAQYDAIVAAATSGTLGWRPGAQHVLVVTTDAPFHTPDGTHLNDEASTIAALNANNIIVIGLKAPGAGLELNALAAATGGSVQPLSSNGANIAAAILAGLQALTTDVWHTVVSDPELTVSLTPAVHYGVPGNTAVAFTETIAVDPNAAQGQTYTATVTFWANTYSEGKGEEIGRQLIKVYVPDTTPPLVSSTETVNPAGKKTPPAGNTTLPGPKGGMNEDGFYVLNASDNVDPNPLIYVTTTTPFGPVFGPFTNGTIVKFTESIDEPPVAKPMGGPNSAVQWHIILPTDALVVAVDAAGNFSFEIQYVPPLPK